MKSELVERACSFFNLDFNEVVEESKKTDLYSAISKLTGISRLEIKKWMHGFAYGNGKINFERR